MLCLVTQSCLTLCDPMDCNLPDSVHKDSPGKNTGVGCHMPSSRGSSQPRDWTQVSYIADGFTTIWATGKPKNTGVGSLSLLQGIFPTQEPNWDLLHCRQIPFFFFCRQILYQLSYQGEVQNYRYFLINIHFPFFCYLLKIKWSILYSFTIYTITLFP